MPVGTRLFCTKPPKTNNPSESIPQSTSKGTSAVHSTIISKPNEIKIGKMSINIAKNAGIFFKIIKDFLKNNFSSIVLQLLSMHMKKKNCKTDSFFEINKNKF
jgi:phosphoribosylcarboxyaminoimidazole (NCAIR) mutase